MPLKSIYSILKIIPKAILFIISVKKSKNLNFKAFNKNHKKNFVEKELFLRHKNKNNFHNFYLSNVRIYSFYKRINLQIFYFLNRYKFFKHKTIMLIIIY